VTHQELVKLRVLIGSALIIVFSLLIGAYFLNVHETIVPAIPYQANSAPAPTPSTGMER
jgi:hypothetical protein